VCCFDFCSVASLTRLDASVGLETFLALRNAPPLKRLQVKRASLHAYRPLIVAVAALQTLNLLFDFDPPEDDALSDAYLRSTANLLAPLASWLARLPALLTLGLRGLDAPPVDSKLLTGIKWRLPTVTTAALSNFVPMLDLTAPALTEVDAVILPEPVASLRKLTSLHLSRGLSPSAASRLGRNAKALRSLDVLFMPTLVQQLVMLPALERVSIRTDRGKAEEMVYFPMAQQTQLTLRCSARHLQELVEGEVGSRTFVRSTSQRRMSSFPTGARPSASRPAPRRSCDRVCALGARRPQTARLAPRRAQHSRRRHVWCG